mgnify:CR=1 FL=1
MKLDLIFELTLNCLVDVLKDSAKIFDAQSRKGIVQNGTQKKLFEGVKFLKGDLLVGVEYQPGLELVLQKRGGNFLGL